MPIVKKGKGEKVGKYKGVMVMSTLYKIYAGVLANRLREEVEKKGMIPPNQTGFRREMGTIDNIYVLNYLLHKRIERKGGKLVAIFVDLRATFDSVDRGELIKAMRKRGVGEGLTERIEELLRETKSGVRVGGGMEERFGQRGTKTGISIKSNAI